MAEESTTPDLVELAREVFEAANCRDLDALMSLYTPDAVWDLSHVGLGTFEGAAAIRAFYEEWLGNLEEYEVEAQEILDLGHDVVFVAYQEDARMTGSEGRVRQRACWVAVVVEGLVSGVTYYMDIDEARAAAERLAEERG